MGALLGPKAKFGSIVVLPTELNNKRSSLMSNFDIESKGHRQSVQSKLSGVPQIPNMENSVMAVGGSPAHKGQPPPIFPTPSPGVFATPTLADLNVGNKKFESVPMAKNVSRDGKRAS